MSIKLHERAFALRPIRIDKKNNRFINYEGTTFPKSPWHGCEMYLRRAALFGPVTEEQIDDVLAIDVLDCEGDHSANVRHHEAQFRVLASFTEIQTGTSQWNLTRGLGLGIHFGN